MTICTILASLESADSLESVMALCENAKKVYAFDPDIVRQVVHAAQAATYRLCHPSAVSTSTVDLPQPGELCIELDAICHTEPRGDCGLEGYQRGGTYRCQFVRQVGKPPYYRVFPGEPAAYYECAVPRHIVKFFTLEENA